jgi:hypothetical protein
LSLIPPVKSIFLNIGLHLARDQIHHRLPSFDQLPDFCRRDIQNRDLFKVEGMTRSMDPTLDLLVIAENRDQGLWEWRGGKGLLKPGAGHHDEVAKGEEVLKFFPGLDLHECVPSQDEEEDILMPLTEIPDGINRVRFLWS